MNLRFLFFVLTTCTWFTTSPHEGKLSPRAAFEWIKSKIPGSASEKAAGENVELLTCGDLEQIIPSISKTAQDLAAAISNCQFTVEQPTGDNAGIDPNKCTIMATCNKHKSSFDLVSLVGSLIARSRESVECITKLFTAITPTQIALTETLLRIDACMQPPFASQCALYSNYSMITWLSSRNSLQPLFNTLDSDGNNALHHVSNPECAELLIKNGTSVNHANSEQDTPLHSAVHEGNAGVVATLLIHGADPFKSNNASQIPLQRLGRGCLGALQALMLYCPQSTINKKDMHGRTALHNIVFVKGCVSEKILAAEALLRAGADVTIADNNGSTPVDLVKRYGPTSGAADLIKFYEDRNIASKNTKKHSRKKSRKKKRSSSAIAKSNDSITEKDTITTRVHRSHSTPTNINGHNDSIEWKSGSAWDEESPISQALAEDPCEKPLLNSH
jgi:ankyrin repeat protein